MKIKIPPFKCLFCLSTGNSFIRAEHPIPESLGNDEIIIEPGFICDECNNYFGSKLEQRVLCRPPFNMERIKSCVKTKKGKFSKIESPSLSLYGTEYYGHPIIVAQKDVEIKPDDPRLYLHGKNQLIVFPSVVDDEKNILRLLLKMGLELLLLTEREDPYLPQYDMARKVARFAPLGTKWEMAHMVYPKSEDLIISTRYDEIGQLTTRQLYSYDVGRMKDGSLGFCFTYTTHIFTVNLNSPSIDKYIKEFNEINLYKMGKVCISI